MTDTTLPSHHDLTTVTRVATTELPTPWATFRCVAYRSVRTGNEHLALTLGEPTVTTGGGTGGGAEAPLVRLHSECLTGDVFGSARCDCGPQLHQALATVAEAGTGAVLYLRGHEGRGIGLAEKIRAYRLQDDGLDTVDANRALGLPDDARDYVDGAAMLHDLGLGAVRLLTNNPAKVAGLRAAGVRVVAQVPVLTTAGPHNERYLRTKRERMGHLLAPR
ncbi:MAG: GTP cyclohydrolase II [Acidimicrobiales bacterium]